jgi:integrase
MSVTVREYKKRGKKGWEVDINVLLPNGTRWRERRKSPTSSKSGAMRWAEAREREVLLAGPPCQKKEVPTLTEFAPRFIEDHSRANRHKPSGIAAKESTLRVHLIPLLGSKRLDQITTEAVQQLKRHLVDRAPKTVNNTLTVLNTALKKAVEWGVIDQMPCLVRLLPVPRTPARFHDFSDYERLLAAGRELGSDAELIILLGGQAGLRLGEIAALEWTDVDSTAGRICVQRSEWRGHVTVPKGGPFRYVKMTARLAAAFREHQHRGGGRVLCRVDGSPLTPKMVSDRVRRAAARAGLGAKGVHVLRHTFLFAPCDEGCSRARDSGVCRSPGIGDDGALHAPQSCGTRRGNPATRLSAAIRPTGDMLETRIAEVGKRM